MTERLLSISGEDRQSIDRKYRDHWHGQLGVRFLVLTNELPRIIDASGTIASRFIPLLLRESFYGREDRQLTNKLLVELPGILNWALDGLEYLQERGYFEIPDASYEAIRQLEDLASPVRAFVRDWCSTHSEDRENVKFLYDAWKTYAEQHGHASGNSIVFGRNLRAALPHVSTGGRGLKRYYRGVQLTEHGEKQFQIFSHQA